MDAAGVTAARAERATAKAAAAAARLKTREADEAKLEALPKTDNTKGEAVIDGAALVHAETPAALLLEATIFVKKLQVHSPNAMVSHVLACKLYTRKQKPLLVLRALKQAARIDSAHPDFLTSCVSFFHSFDQSPPEFKLARAAAADNTTDYTAELRRMISEERKQCAAFGAGKPMADVVTAYIATSAKTCTTARFAAARAHFELDAKSTEKCAALCTTTDGKTAAVSPGTSAQTCAAILDFVRGELKLAAQADAFLAVCAATFPLAVRFNPEILEKRAAVAAAAAAEKAAADAEAAAALATATAAAANAQE
jgi:hypothetical protein